MELSADRCARSAIPVGRLAVGRRLGSPSRALPHGIARFLPGCGPRPESKEAPPHLERSRDAMESPPSTPDPHTQRRVISAGGTIVGMPAVIPSKTDRDAAKYFEQLKSTTLRSVYSVQGSAQTRVEEASDVESGPCSDPFHPERWSSPPPSGADPIYPCDEPEEESEAVVMQALEARARLAAFAERNADAAVAETEAGSPSETELVVALPVTTESPPSPSAAADAPTKSDVYVDEFAYIPMRRSSEDRRLLVIAAIASGGVIVAALSALTVLL